MTVKYPHGAATCTADNHVISVMETAPGQVAITIWNSDGTAKCTIVPPAFDDLQPGDNAVNARYEEVPAHES